MTRRTRLARLEAAKPTRTADPVLVHATDETPEEAAARQGINLQAIAFLLPDNNR